MRGDDKQLRIEDLPTGIAPLMVGPVPPADFVSNGCTCSPDYVLGADLRPACHWHDYHYAIGTDEPTRRDADYNFYGNLRRCGAGRWLAFRYFAAVRLFGGRAFTYAKPPEWTWGDRWRLLVSVIYRM